MSTTSEIRQQCSECGGTIIVKNRGLVGKKVTCPKCKKAVLVQDVSAKAKLAQSEREAEREKDKSQAKQPKRKKAAQQNQVKLLLFVGGGLLAVAVVVVVILFLVSGTGGDRGAQGNANGGPAQGGAGGQNGAGGVPPGQGGAQPGQANQQPGQFAGNLDALLADLQNADPNKVQAARQKLVQALQQASEQMRGELIKRLQDLAVKLADRDYNPPLHVLDLASRSLRSSNAQLRRELAEAISTTRRRLATRHGNWQGHATNLIPNETQMFVHIPVARLLRGFPQQLLFEQAGFLPQDFEHQLGVELSQLADLVVAGLPTRQQCMIVVTTNVPMDRQRVEAALQVQKDSRQTRAGKEYYLGRSRFLGELLGGRFPLDSLSQKAAVYLDPGRKTLVIAHEELLAAWLEKPPALQWRLGEGSAADANLPPADFATFLTLERDFRLLVDRIDREGPYALLYGEWRTQKQSRDLLAGIKAWLQWTPAAFHQLAAKDLEEADGLAFALVQLPEAPIAVNLALHAPSSKGAERIKALALRTKLPAIRQALADALAANVIIRDLDTELQVPASGQAGGEVGGGGPGAPPPDAGGSGPMGQPMPPGGGPGGSAPGEGADVGPGGPPPLKPIQPNIGGAGGTGAAGPPPGPGPGIKPISPNIGGGGSAPAGGSAPGGALEGPPARGQEGGYPHQPGQPPPDNFPIDPNKPNFTIIIQQTDEYVQITFGLTQPTKPVVDTLEEQLLYARGEMQLRTRPFRIHELARAANAYPPNHSRTFPPGALLAPGESFGLRGGLLLEDRISFFRELLPYLDDDRYRQLYRQIDPSKPWFDAQNLRAARVLVPHFLHPSAVPFYGSAPVDNQHVRVALTHFVGMAGVGPDAPFYRKDDPRAGIFGDPTYRGPTSLDDIRDGTSNTILLIQADSRLAGPWIQGGGATMRGTSLPGNDVGKPYGFVAPPHGGKMGTFVVMADGSVRFITRDIAHEVFKALCTMAGGEPIPSVDNVAPLVPPFENGNANSKPAEKARPTSKSPEPISRRDPWTPEAAALAQLAPETSLGPFRYRPPMGYRGEHGKPTIDGEMAARWVGPVHQDVGTPPMMVVSLTPLDANLAGEPLDVVIKQIVSRFPADDGKWEFDNAVERGLIHGILFGRVACRFVGQDNQRLEGYYYQHTDGRMGLGVLILDHSSHAATTLPLLEASVATFRKQ